jgi:hypothetical protein
MLVRLTQTMHMKKTIFLLLVLVICSAAMSQAVGHIDKKTKEFYIPAGQKTEYRIFGYQFANTSTQKMICFSTNNSDVRANMNNCSLGAYFDTNSLREGDKIVYLGPTGTFGKMNFISGSGKKTVFYLLKSAYSFK